MEPEAIQTEARPAAPVHAWQRLDPRAVRLWRISLLVWVVPVVLVVNGALVTAVLITPLSPAWLVLGVVLLVLLGTLVTWWPPHRYDAFRFRLAESAVVVRQGVLWRYESIVPYARIQHVDTQHGPLQRRFGLADVVAHTAGSAGAAVALPMLERAEAEATRDRLIELSGGGDAV